MSLILGILGALLLLMATAGAVFGVVATVAMGRFLGRPLAKPAKAPAVAILRRRFAPCPLAPWWVSATRYAAEAARLASTIPRK